MRRDGADTVAYFIHYFAGEKVGEDLHAEADGGEQGDDEEGNFELRLESDVEKRHIVDDQRLYDVSRVTGENRMLVV